MVEKDLATQAFERQYSKIMIRRALFIWNSKLLKSFQSWFEYTKYKEKTNVLILRMRYWRVSRAIKRWNLYTDKKMKNRYKKNIAKKIGNRNLLSQVVYRWSKHVHIIHKIRHSCYQQNKSFNSIAVGLGILKNAVFRNKRNRIYAKWAEEYRLHNAMEKGQNWNRRYIIRMVLKQWLEHLRDNKRKRKCTRAVMMQRKFIAEFFVDMQAEIDAIEEDKPTSPELQKSPIDMAKVRNEFNFITDRHIMAIQRNRRKMRVETEKDMILTNWKDYWEQHAKERIKDLRCCLEGWIKSKEAKSKLLKLYKVWDKRFHNVTNIERENNLASSKHIALCLIDSIIGKIGKSWDEFFQYFVSNRQLEVTFNELESSVKKFGIEIEAFYLRNLFEQLITDETNKRIKIDDIKAPLRTVWNDFGSEGCQWKMYISPAHNIMIFHDIINNEVRLYLMTTSQSLFFSLQNNR